MANLLLFIISIAIITLASVASLSYLDDASISSKVKGYATQYSNEINQISAAYDLYVATNAVSDVEMEDLLNDEYIDSNLTNAGGAIYSIGNFKNRDRIYMLNYVFDEWATQRFSCLGPLENNDIYKLMPKICDEIESSRIGGLRCVVDNERILHQDLYTYNPGVTTKTIELLDYVHSDNYITRDLEQYEDQLEGVPDNIACMTNSEIYKLVMNGTISYSQVTLIQSLVDEAYIADIVIYKE